MDVSQRKKSIFDPRMQDRSFGLSNFLKERLDEANQFKNITHSRKFALNFQKSKEVEELHLNEKDEVIQKVSRESIIASKMQESQYIKDLLKNKLFYNQRIEVSNVDLTSSEDSDLVIHILKKEFKNKKEISFLKFAISGLTLFKQNQDILFKENMAMTLFKELKYEFFLEKDPIFHFGQVQLLIPKPEIAKEIEKKREESQNNFNQKFLKNISKNASSSKNIPRKSILTGDFNSIQQQNIDSRKKSQTVGTSTQEIEEDQKETFDSNLTYEQILETYYKGWNLIKLFGPGDAFGEIALLTKQRRIILKYVCLKIRTGTMICKHDTHIMSLTKEAFDKLLGKYHERVKQEKIGFLRQFQVFDGVPTSKLLSLIHDMKTNTYQINNILYEEGDKVEDIFFIKDGEVELSKLANVQNQKDFIQISNMKQDEKFLMYNLKHNRQIQREQKIRMRISVITSGECFGDYEIKNDEIYRTQKAVVTRQNTLIYSLHKSLLLDMLKTHKISDNIIKQNDQNVKFHEQREKDIIDQNIKNQNATNNLVKKHIKKQLKHAMKLPDLSLLNEEDQKSLYQQFPYLQNLKKNNDKHQMEQISGSNQKLNQSNLFLKNSEGDDQTQNGSDQSQQKINLNQIFSPKLDLSTYQQFTSNFLKKPICMKLNQDAEYKQINLDYIREHSSKKIISRQTSIRSSQQCIPSSSGNGSDIQYFRNSDSDSQDEQMQKSTGSKFKILKSSASENRKTTNTSQELFFPIDKDIKNYKRKSSISKSLQKSQKKESESPRKQEEKRFSLKNLLLQQNQKEFSQDGSFSSKNQSSSFYQKMKNPQNCYDEDKINVNTSFQTSNLEQSGEFNKSELNSQEQIPYQKQHMLINKDKLNKISQEIKFNKTLKAFSQHDEGKSQEDAEELQLQKQNSSNKSYTEQNSSIETPLNHKQQQHIPFSHAHIDKQEKDQSSFTIEKGNKEKEKSKEQGQPLFWIEDNSLLSKEQKRRKINYVMHQSYKILNQIGLQKNNITLYIGDEKIKKYSSSFKSNNSSFKQELQNQNEKSDQIQSPTKQELCKSYSLNQSAKQNNQEQPNTLENENKNEQESNQEEQQIQYFRYSTPKSKSEKKIYSEKKKIGKSCFQDLSNSLQDYEDEIISNDQQFKSNWRRKHPLRKLLSQGNSPKNSNFNELISIFHDKDIYRQKEKSIQKSTLPTEIVENKNNTLRNTEFTNNLIFSCDVDQNARIFDQRSQSQDQMKKVEKILENYSKQRKLSQQNLFSSVQMTSKQKREMLFASNYHLPTQGNFQNQYSPKIPALSPKISQNTSFLLNSNINQFNLCVKSSNTKKQVKKKIDISQISFLSINPASKFPPVQQDEKKMFTQVEQSDKSNQSYSLFQKSRKDRKSLQSLCGFNYICEKQFTQNSKNQETIQDNTSQDQKSVTNQKQSTQLNSNTSEMSINQKRNSFSQIFYNPHEQQNKGQNQNIQQSNQLKNVNNSAFMLQSIVGYQKPFPTHHKKSYSSFLSQFDQVKEQSENTNYKTQNYPQKQMWNSQLKINIAQVGQMSSKNHSEINSPKLANLSSKINNQSIMPAFPKIMPSPNILLKENSRDLKAQQLLLKRNLV